MRRPKVGAKKPPVDGPPGRILDADSQLGRALPSPLQNGVKLGITPSPEPPLEVRDGAGEVCPDIGHASKDTSILGIVKADCSDHAENPEAYPEGMEPTDIWPKRVRFRELLEAYCVSHNSQMDDILHQLKRNEIIMTAILQKEENRPDN